MYDGDTSFDSYIVPDKALFNLKETDIFLISAQTYAVGSH